jgi:hypothetical protein
MGHCTEVSVGIVPEAGARNRNLGLAECPSQRSFAMTVAAADSRQPAPVRHRRSACVVRDAGAPGHPPALPPASPRRHRRASSRPNTSLLMRVP